MSRFASLSAVERFVIGACQCPGTPHDEDYMDLRSEVGIADMNRIAEFGTNLGVLKVLCVGWNLLEDDGTVAPVDESHIDRLFVDNLESLDAWMNSHVRALTLPNGSGARSANGSRASASATLTIRKRR